MTPSDVLPVKQMAVQANEARDAAEKLVRAAIQKVEAAAREHEQATELLGMVGAVHIFPFLQLALYSSSFFFQADSGQIPLFYPQIGPKYLNLETVLAL
jgi:hypothetical protein